MRETTVPGNTANRDEMKDTLIRRIQKNLTSEEALLEYCFGDSSLFVITVLNDTAACFRLGSNADLRQKIISFSAALRNADTDVSLNLGSELYDLVVFPFAKLISGRERLIIIPDEELCRIPFEALINDHSPVPRNGGPVHYFIFDHQVSYHFSATAWSDGGASGEIPMSFCGFAPVQFALASNLNPLPGTKNEILSIAKKFSESGSPQRIFTDTAATERNFRASLDKPEIIHVASHSMTDFDHPGNSGIYFADWDPGDKNIISGTASEDGILHLDEIQGLKINCPLIVLSSCATGMGVLTRTEGMIALSRAFYMAGAQNVVWSLWSVRDQQTNSFMKDFYSGLLSGMTVSSALQKAKLLMISRPETSLPLLWAGFVVTAR
jgi:CHAT domain-containing protein